MYLKSHVILKLHKEKGICNIEALDSLNIPSEIIKSTKKTIKIEMNDKFNQFKKKNWIIIYPVIGLFFIFCGALFYAKFYNLSIILLISGIFLILFYPLYIWFLKRKQLQMINSLCNKVETNTHNVIFVIKNYLNENKNENEDLIDSSKHILTKFKNSNNKENSQKIPLGFKFIINESKLAFYLALDYENQSKQSTSEYQENLIKNPSINETFIPKSN